MCRSIVIIATVLGLALFAHAADKTVSYEHLIKADPLPQGYKLVPQDITQGPYHVHALNVIKPNGSAKAIILVGSIKVLTDEDRAKSIKSYWDSTTRKLESTGWKTVSDNSPDVSQADLSKPYVASKVLENKDGKKRYLWTRVFFAGVGYHIGVVADSEDALKVLQKWAESVKEDGTRSVWVCCETTKLVASIRLWIDRRGA
jgi:hypothetical protein